MITAIKIVRDMLDRAEDRNVVTILTEPTVTEWERGLARGRIETLGQLLRKLEERSKDETQTMRTKIPPRT